MTEDEWLAGEDPQEMLTFIEGKVGNRKLRVFGVACCRRAGTLLRHDFKTLADAEDHSDGLLGDEDLMHAWWNACEANDEEVRRQGEIRDTVLGAAFRVVYETEHLFDTVLEVCRVASSPGERAPLVEAIHDLFGNPFRPITIEPAWLTSTVTSLAQVIYADREFDRLQILADALEDAGCHDADIIGHCREEGSIHVRGCWAVDLRLGKE